jgi:hypothetical protein
LKPRNFVWVALGTFALGLGVLVGGFARTGQVQAQGQEPKLVTCRADFAVLGLSGREKALVHAAWVEGDGDPVNVKFQFIDRSGQVLLEDGQAIEPSQTATSVLDPPGRLDKSERLEFRATVIVEPGSGAPGFPAEKGCPQVITSLERTTARGDGILVLLPSCEIGAVCHKLTIPSPPPSTPPTDLPNPTDVPPSVDVAPSVDARPPVDFHFPADMPPPVDAPPPPADMPPPPPPVDAGPPPADMPPPVDARPPVDAN